MSSINTVQTRKEIGFPKNKSDWAKASASYDEHSLKILGHPVMEDWELGYMKMLAKIASSKHGRVLEVGYGLGLSAKAIQSEGIKEHFVIECHPDVISRCVKDMRDEISDNKLHIVSGFWQDVTHLFASDNFDGILFDTYPLREEEIHSNHFWFFEEAYRLLKPGGILTYYSDEKTDYSENHFNKLVVSGFKAENIQKEICNVNPPEDCEYWQSKTIMAPIIKK